MSTNSNSNGSNSNAATTTLEGQVRKFIWQKPDNAWAVAVFADADGDEHKVAGGISHCEIGKTYRLDGRLEENRYGTTLKVATVIAVQPRGNVAVMAYLKTLPHVGPRAASDLVRAFGDQAPEMLETSSLEDLKVHIRALNPERLDEIRECLRAERDSREIDMQVRDLLGELATDKLVKKCLDEWGRLAPATINRNPWVLTDLPQIGFLRADSIAQRIGADLRSDPRVRASVLYVVEDMRGSGHTRHPFATVREKAYELLGFRGHDDQELVGSTIASMIADGLFSGDATNLQLREDADAEAEIAKILRSRMDPIGPLAGDDGAADVVATAMPLRDAEPPAGLFPDQVTALATLRACGPGGTCLLTGAPGTGKTTMVKAFFPAFAAENIALCAPTGKAAKRLAQQAGMPATTIHRLLEPTPATDAKGKTRFSFSRGYDQPIDKLLVVVDEASMVDTRLFCALLRATPRTCYLLIVGDPNQLPSVSPGSILRDLIECGKIPHAQLTQIKRTNPGLLLRSIHGVKDGRWTASANDPAGDLFVVPAGGEEACIETMASLYLDRLPKMLPAGSDPIQDIQLLVPWKNKKGLSTKTVNEEIQRRRATCGSVELGKWPLGVGDKVIQTSNDYQLGIVNGDQGVIRAMQEEVPGMVIDADAGADGDGWPTKREGTPKLCYIVEFAGYAQPTAVPAIGNDLELAYAVTVHKSQGSEWPIIVLPAVGAQSFFYDRTLLYTAMSRAQRMLVIVGPQDGLQRVVDRTAAERRRTGLQALLKS